MTTKKPQSKKERKEEITTQQSIENQKARRLDKERKRIAAEKYSINDFDQERFQEKLNKHKHKGIHITDE